MCNTCVAAPNDMFRYDLNTCKIKRLLFNLKKTVAVIYEPESKDKCLSRNEYNLNIQATSS